MIPYSIVWAGTLSQRHPAVPAAPWPAGASA